MTTVANLKTQIISKIQSIDDENLLTAVQTILDKVPMNDDFPNQAQIEMLQLSEEDIKYGRVTDSAKVKIKAEKWLEDQKRK